MGNRGEVFTYMFVRASAKASSFIPVVGAFAGGANSQSQILTLTFGPDGILTDFLNSKSASDVNAGAATAPRGEFGEVESGKRPK